MFTFQTLICKVIYWKEKSHGQHSISNNFPFVGEGCFGLSHNDPGDGANQAGVFPSLEYPGMVKVGACILISRVLYFMVYSSQIFFFFFTFYLFMEGCGIWKAILSSS